MNHAQHPQWRYLVSLGSLGFPFDGSLSISLDVLARLARPLSFGIFDSLALIIFRFGSSSFLAVGFTLNSDGKMPRQFSREFTRISNNFYLFLSFFTPVTDFELLFRVFRGAQTFTGPLTRSFTFCHFYTFLTSVLY